MMPSWQSTASCSKSLRVASKISLETLQALKPDLLLSAANAAALWPYLMFPFLLTEGFSVFLPLSVSPQEVHAVCQRRVVLSLSSAVLLLPPAFPLTNPSNSGSAVCCWRYKHKKKKKKKTELYSCTLAKTIINGQKAEKGRRGRECGKIRKSKMLLNAANN